MTTLIGLHAAKGKEGVILVSDLSATKYSENKNEAPTKVETQKIYIDKDRQFALSMSGSYDEIYVEFLQEILNGKINVEKAFKEGYLKELKDINLARWRGKIPTGEYNSLLIASRFNDKPELYTCWPLGKVDQKDWVAIGSGSRFSEEYTSEQGIFTPKTMSLDEGIKISLGALNSASQDLYTSGLDMVVITPDKIKEFGKELKTSMNDTKTKWITKVIKECI